MGFQLGAVDWLGLAGSLALVVPPTRMELAKLRIFFEERKEKANTDPQGLRPYRQHLIDCMKAHRDNWRFIDSLFLFLGGGILALSFLVRGWTA